MAQRRQDFEHRQRTAIIPDLALVRGHGLHPRLLVQKQHADRLACRHLGLEARATQKSEEPAQRSPPLCDGHPALADPGEQPKQSSADEQRGLVFCLG